MKLATLCLYPLEYWPFRAARHRKNLTRGASSPGTVRDRANCPQQERWLLGTTGTGQTSRTQGNWPPGTSKDRANLPQGALAPPQSTRDRAHFPHPGALAPWDQGQCRHSTHTGALAPGTAKGRVNLLYTGALTPSQCRGQGKTPTQEIAPLGLPGTGQTSLKQKL
jgi:hypothetical protein